MGQWKIIIINIIYMWEHRVSILRLPDQGLNSSSNLRMHIMLYCFQVTNSVLNRKWMDQKKSHMTGPWKADMTVLLLPRSWKWLECNLEILLRWKLCETQAEGGQQASCTYDTACVQSFPWLLITQEWADKHNSLCLSEDVLVCELYPL